MHVNWREVVAYLMDQAPYSPIVPAMLRSDRSSRFIDRNRISALGVRLTGPEASRALPVIFLTISIINLGRQFQELLGVDARIYIRAAAHLRNGLSPWDAFVADPSGYQLHFTALPPSVAIFTPFTFVPERLAVWLWIWASLLAAAYVVRRLKLPIWWLLFPPLTEGIFTANPQIVLMALLLSGSAILASLAPVLKIYAIAPLIGERRWTALLLVLGLLLLSFGAQTELWAQYLSRAGDIAVRNFNESIGGFSAFAVGPWLVVLGFVGLLMLAVTDWRAAGWMAAPAILPVSQFHLSTFAMPVLAERSMPIMAVLFALPIRGLPSAAVALLGAWSFYRWVGRRREPG